MHGLLLRADDVLRARPELLRQGQHGRSILIIVVLVAVFGMTYGVVMGSYGGVRPLQMLYSCIKMPLLLLATFALSLPSFFVANTLLGVRDDFAQCFRALVATLAGLTIILASFAPFTALWYVSTSSYDGAKMFNLLMFGIASISAQLLLRQFYRPLVERDPRHRALLRLWLVIFGFVGVQMGWVLRPFIGKPNTPTQFFRADAWSNAYVEVAETMWRLMTGG